MTQRAQIFNCIKQNNLRQVKLLVEGGCDVNIKEPSTGRSPLIACLVHIHDANARLRIMTQLLNAGADVNQTDKHRKSPLTYACTLDQPDSVRLLLQKDGINPNQTDLNGATPLMHAAALGNLDSVKVMMEHKQLTSQDTNSTTVAIEMCARDNNSNTALDHAISSGNDHNNKTGTLIGVRQAFDRAAEVQALLEANMDEKPDEEVRKHLPPPGEDIELVDMSGKSSGTKSVGSSPRLTRNKTGPSAGKNNSLQVKDNPRQRTKSESDKIGADSSEIRKWADNVKNEHGDAARLSTLVSPSVSNMGRPGSRQSTSSRPPSSLSLQSGPKNHRPGSSFEKHGLSRKKESLLVPDDDDDEDFSLQSLSDLVGTVRQYAKEIKEIYEPIKKEEEERVEKRKRHKERRNKELNNALDAFKAKKGSVSGPSMPTSPVQHEVRVEIHRLEEQLQNSDLRGKGKDRPRGPTHSKSHEPSPSHPVALLHVENEQLSSTWPRGRRPVSSDRSRQNDGASGVSRGSGSLKGTSSSSSGPSHSRPQIPSDWNDDGTIQHERDILNKAFLRMNNQGTTDPLLNNLIKKTGAPQGKIQKKVQHSRDSVIQVAKEHKSTRQTSTALPSISIIPPPTNASDKPWANTGSGVYGNDVIMPSDRKNVYEDIQDMKPGRMSKNGGAGVKSSTKGLRRRKSQDQGMGTQVQIEKY